MGTIQSYMPFFGIVIATTILVITIVCLIRAINARLNYYPNKTLEIDLTNKRKMDDDDLIDYYIINFGTQQIQSHIDEVWDWKSKKIATYQGRTDKIDKFETRCLKNQYKAFRFIGYRTQTRYKQVNYQRYPYQVDVDSNDFYVDEKFIRDRISFLSEHDYNVTYNQYTRVDQRKALTKQLKEVIKERDNYTCQICGKYMPDEVGLHIDHIVPIIKGGKSIPTNLRVLCSKCNGRKGGK